MLHREGGRLECTASGYWTAANASELENLITKAQQAFSGANEASINMSGVGAFDTFGAWLIERFLREGQRRSRPVGVIGLRPEFSELLQDMGRVNREETQPQKPEPGGPLSRLGLYVANEVLNLAPFFQMLGSVSLAIARLLARPRSFRFTSAVHQLDRVAWQATPIIVLMTFLIGCIISQQGFFHFRRFGAENYVVDMVGILILREIGVLLVTIMVAGRSGSSYTAELGSMKMREEIDALRTMGLDPVEVLILPRLIALVIAVPVLTFLGSLSALYGAGIVAWLYDGMSPQIFLARLHDAITITHFKVGMIKAPFMALIIGIVACSEGFGVKGSSESLGLQTTTSVVRSIFLVIVMDGLFAIFFSAIGM
jgi:phospholipid/cholesterol/gamma-HCH transport system permease protein